MSDILVLNVPDEEVGSINADTRPAWVEGGMPCPVAQCGTRVYKTYFAMLRHWVAVHARTVTKFKCPNCTYYNVRRNQVSRHLKRIHRLEAVGLVIREERVVNSRYVPPGPVRIPIKGVAPSNVPVVPDEELLQYVDEMCH